MRKEGCADNRNRDAARNQGFTRRTFLSTAALATVGATAGVAAGLSGCTPDTGASSDGKTGATGHNDASGAAPAVAQAPRPEASAKTTEGHTNERTSADGRGRAYEQDGWTVVHIEGAPYERGRQHGELLAAQIADLVDRVARRCYVECGAPWSVLKTAAVDAWSEKLGNELRDELQGIADGAAAHEASVAGVPIDFADVLAWNAHNELFDFLWGEMAADYYAALAPDVPDPVGQTALSPAAPASVNSDNDHCSAFIATGSATSDGGIVIAHNTFGDFTYAQHLSVLVDVVPDTGSRLLFQGAPGYVHSPTDYYNSEHLVITATGIGGFSAYDPTKTPLFVRGRLAAQHAETLDAFVELVSRDNNGGSAVAWLAGALNTGEIMLFEQGLKFMHVARTFDGVFSSCNAPIDPRIRAFETSNSGFADLRRHQGARQARFVQLFGVTDANGVHTGTLPNGDMAPGLPLDTEQAQSLLADHFDVYTQTDNPCSRTLCAHYELDAREYMSQPGRPMPFQPRGAVDGIVADGTLARTFSLEGRWGSSCGTPFDAAAFLARNPQYGHLKDFLDDRPTRPWTMLTP